MRMGEGTTVRSVERALDILLCFTEDTGLTMSEIAQRVNLHKSTVHRLLASLEKKGFVFAIHQQTNTGSVSASGNWPLICGNPMIQPSSCCRKWKDCAI